MKYQLRLISAMLVVLAWTWCGHSSAGTIPLTIHLDGSASGTSGNLNGDYLTRIRLFQGGDPVAGTGGTLVYEESVTLTYSNGLFSHELGEGTAPPSCGSETPCVLDEGDFDTNDPLYIELAIVGETLLPWFDVSSVPFAIRSARVNTVDAAGGGTIQGDLQVDGIGAFGTGHTVGGPGVFVAGQNNTVSGDWATIGGGTENSTSGWTGVVGGGFANTASGLNGPTVGGGHENTASGGWSTVAGGWQNEASDDLATIGGGFANMANDDHSTIAGGSNNVTDAAGSTVGGGENNTASGNQSVVCGGKQNTAEGTFSVIAGGSDNHVMATHSAILGGYRDTITAGADRSYLFGIDSKLTQSNTFMVDMPHIRFGNEVTGYEFPTADGLADEFLTTDGAGVLTWGTPPASSDGDWTISGNDLYTSVSGNVGIGTSSPQAKLHVSEAPGNESVILPDDAISAAELESEPGIAVASGGGGEVLLPAHTLDAADLVIVTIDIPVAGYIHVQGYCTIEVSGSLGQCWVYVDISETAGGDVGDFPCGGFTVYPNDDDHYMSIARSRVYWKSAGTHVFRLKGEKRSSSHTVRAYYRDLVATFFPTAYGAVQTTVAASKSTAFEQKEQVADASSEIKYRVDLRELELRAARAQTDAERAKRELLEAQLQSSGDTDPDALSVQRNDR